MSRMNWNTARRVHQYALLTTLILLWGLTATSMFMANASVPGLEAEPAHSFHPLPFEGSLAGAPAPSAPATAEDAAEALAAAQLPELERLLRLKASSLSSKQKADYAAALRTALHELLPNAPVDGGRAPAQSQHHQPTRSAGADTDAGASRPVAAPRVDTHDADVTHATGASSTTASEEGDGNEEGEDGEGGEGAES